MPVQTQIRRARTRGRVGDVGDRCMEGDRDQFPERVASLRAQVFELVSDLRREELDGVGDQMQSIANQLGDVEAALSARQG